MITGKNELTDVPIGDLIPYERNPRKNDDAVPKIAASLERFGLVKNSVVVDENMVLITGHTTTKAMRSLGWTTCPAVTQVFGLTEEEKVAYRIADNKLGELAEWDLDLLAGELASLDEVGFDAELTGFDTDALAEMCLPEKREVAEDDYEPPVEIETSIQRGDLFTLGRHRLLCGDSTSAEDVGRLMRGEKADMVITSPPYWNQREYASWETFDAYMDDMRKIWRHWGDALRNGAILFWNIGDDSPNHRHISAHHSVSIEQEGFTYIDSIIWKKQGVTGIRLAHQKLNHRYYPGFCFEPLLIFQKPGGAFPEFDADAEVPLTNVWEISTESQMGGKHSAPYPVKLPATAATCYSRSGDLILDPFLGSGTTLIACEQLGRTCYGMEISPQYCQVIIDRWEKLTGQKAERVDGN